MPFVCNFFKKTKQGSLHAGEYDFYAERCDGESRNYYGRSAGISYSIGLSRPHRRNYRFHYRVKRHILRSQIIEMISYFNAFKFNINS